MEKLIEKIRTAWRLHRPANEVKCFRENQEKEEAFDTVDRGLGMVPLDRVIGSVGRYRDFDRSFRPKPHLDSARMTAIRKAMETGRVLPPIRLYQIKDEYFVVDGNHRVSAAKELGYQQIEARILEFLSSKRTMENILYYERTDFEERSGLTDGIELTEIGQYRQLLDQIAIHRDFLCQGADGPVSFKDAARDWHATIYGPLTSIIEKGGILKHFPGRTRADLYAYISVHQWVRPDRTRQYGIGINQLVPKDMEEFRGMMSQLDKSDYPEMVREITAFILMNVSGKKEERVVEKLFDLEEVREVHSVHGNVDILAKITLKRNLLLSDAEMIGDFVHQKVRLIPGVISTQTLIPSRSQMKASREPG